jgi:hypothetical protein
MPPEDSVQVWTRAERLAQLADLRLLCQRMSDLFLTHRDPRAAELMAAKAAHAVQLLREGFTQADLNELGGEFPDGAWWLNPHSFGYHASRQPWQDQVASLRKRARAVALELRSIATR